MRRLLVLLLFFFYWAPFAQSQTAVVKRNVNLRSQAGSQGQILELLGPGALLSLLEPAPHGGYYHVQAGDGQQGWVWSKNVNLSGGPPAPGPPAPGPAPAADLFTRLMNSRKPAVGEPLIENGTAVCGPTGDAKNATAIALNQNKNRTDLPSESDTVDLSWNELVSLPPDRVEDFVSAPVRVIGFLSHKINVENSGKGESTNCHLTGVNQVDWHIYLTVSPAQSIRDATIVETTPRTRPQHQWTTAMLSAVVDSQTPVRISGWLMYDSEHIGAIGKQRATVWEVHPITKIETQSNGKWIDLDQQP